ncbi:hypothetical protein C8K36_107264 [Rhodococcus sp. OK519]|uniref:hypothetical protein n=1 Tax=Rhodococcus sp. OK519 TaxID=2135729 RepID=UPI000D41DEF9|nr:hypothetical protein C8K36_107264 [Rhodococcus sp. OK519]
MDCIDTSPGLGPGPPSMSLRSTSNASTADPVTLPDAPHENVASGMLVSLVAPEL